MNGWKLQRTLGSQTTYARELPGLDRVYAYVDYDQWEDDDQPTHYRWSVQDGSCGEVLDSGYTDEGDLTAAQADADAAAARLFPGHD